MSNSRYLPTLSQNFLVTISLAGRHTHSNRLRWFETLQNNNKEVGNMADYNSALNDIETKPEEKGENKLFWENAVQHEECSDLTVARDLSISIMTIFQIDSIEMKEGFIY